VTDTMTDAKTTSDWSKWGIPLVIAALVFGIWAYDNNRTQKTTCVLATAGVAALVSGMRSNANAERLLASGVIGAACTEFIDELVRNPDKEQDVKVNTGGTTRTITVSGPILLRPDGCDLPEAFWTWKQHLLC
jgi:hypothetical protein